MLMLVVIIQYGYLIRNFFYDKGWKGMNIDLSKESIDLFNISRPNDININLAIGERKEKKIFYYNKKLHHANTLNKNFYNKFLKSYNIKKHKIDVVPLNFLFEKYFKNKNIDLVLDMTKNSKENYTIRRTAIDYNTSLITNDKQIELLVQALEKNPDLKPKSHCQYFENY